MTLKAWLVHHALSICSALTKYLWKFMQSLWQWYVIKGLKRIIWWHFYKMRPRVSLLDEFLRVSYLSTTFIYFLPVVACKFWFVCFYPIMFLYLLKTTREVSSVLASKNLLICMKNLTFKRTRVGFLDLTCKTDFFCPPSVFAIVYTTAFSFCSF